MKRVHHHKGTLSVPRQYAVFANTNPVAMKSHGYTTVGITGMDKVSRHIEVFLH